MIIVRYPGRPKVDIPIGTQFGAWTVIERIGVRDHALMFRCRCKCGAEKDIAGAQLRHSYGKSKGCRQCRKRGRAVERKQPRRTGKFNRTIKVGDTFGELTVLAEIPLEERSKSARIARAVEWLCRCTCGNEKRFTSGLLNWGKESCGCKGLSEKEAAVARWSQMKQRCSNPKNKGYRLYGARGIRVCDRWFNSFLDFQEDLDREIGPRPGPEYSLDRIDNDGNYEPGNVRWATAAEQNANRRIMLQQAA